MTALPATFWSKVSKTEACWLWTACVQSRGYGCFQVDGRRQSAHRLAYADAKGPIPEGLTIDHLCRAKRCVNPDHLEAVTIAENLRRMRVANGYHVGGTCGKGHPLEGDNLYLHPRGNLVCVTCRRSQAAKDRKRALTKVTS